MRYFLGVLVLVAGFASQPQAAQTSLETARSGESGSGPRTSMAAESPFTNYTAAVVIYVLMIGFLVTLLLIGGLLVVNLGLLSKREEDRVGERTPSDVGILRQTVWPPGKRYRPTLPAEEDLGATPESAGESARGRNRQAWRRFRRADRVAKSGG